MTYSETMIAALSLAVCDLLVKERFKMQMLVNLLEKKGVLSEAELVEVLERETTNGTTLPAIVEEDLRAMQEEIRQRMAARIQELRSHGQEPIN